MGKANRLRVGIHHIQRRPSNVLHGAPPFGNLFAARGMRFRELSGSVKSICIVRAVPSSPIVLRLLSGSPARLTYRSRWRFAFGAPPLRVLNRLVSGARSFWRPSASLLFGFFRNLPDVAILYNSGNTGSLITWQTPRYGCSLLFASVAARMFAQELHVGARRPHIELYNGLICISIRYRRPVRGMRPGGGRHRQVSGDPPGRNRPSCLRFLRYSLWRTRLRFDGGSLILAGVRFVYSPLVVEIFVLHRC